MLAIRWEQDIRLKVLGLSLHTYYLGQVGPIENIIVRNLTAKNLSLT